MDLAAHLIILILGFAPLVAPRSLEPLRDQMLSRAGVKAERLAEGEGGGAGYNPTRALPFRSS